MPLHVFLVHFPIALILVGAAGDLVGTLLGSDGTRRWAGTLLILGAVATLLAFLTGAGAASMLMMSAPRPEYPEIEWHTQWASGAIWPIVATGVLRAMWRSRLAGPHGWANLAAALLSAALVVGISASGLAISHG